MKIHHFLVVALVAIAGTTAAQEKKIYMWYNGDQPKPMPRLLFAVDSSNLKNDTIAIYRYLIQENEFGAIRDFLTGKQAERDTVSTNSGSFDFTIMEADAFSLFQIKKLHSLESRFAGILDILKSSPHRKRVQNNFDNLRSRLSRLKGFQ